MTATDRNFHIRGTPISAGGPWRTSRATRESTPKGRLSPLSLSLKDLLTASAGAAAVLAFLLASAAWASDPEDYEEPAGASFTALLNFKDNVYGASFNSGVWIKDTPIYGDLFLSMSANDIEGAFYSGMGMTVRIMPRWRCAPFAGAGGSFNYPWFTWSGNRDTTSKDSPEAGEKHGEAYWAGHAESGIRLWLESNVRLVEVFGRYTWSSSGEWANYWIFGISTGTGW